MRTASTASASLLVAALVVLRRPCARNLGTARLLLERAADDPNLSHAEREACRSLADELDCAPAAHADTPGVRPPISRDEPRQRRYAPCSPSTLMHDLKGAAA